MKTTNKKTTNKIQEQYILAKAYYDFLENKEAELERLYIYGNGIINPDGSIPERIYCIEDDLVFNKANEEEAATVEALALRKEMITAKEALSVSESKLIEYGLSLAPAKERDILKKSVLKVIDMVLKLDVSSVK